MPRSAKHSKDPRPGSANDARQARAKAFQEYLKKWSVDPAGEQEESWAILKKALQENRSGYRKLFRD